MSEAIPAGLPAAEQAGKAPSPAKAGADASTYCPVCSQRLEGRKCKLICGTCGYYMSCSDYV